MMKFEEAKIEVIKFAVEDVITASGVGGNGASGDVGGTGGADD